MSKGIGNFKARIVRQEAQKPPGKGLLGQGADIRDGYLLGLRFKPAPVFHFFWSGDARRRGSGFFETGKIRTNGCYTRRVFTGGDVW